MNETAADTAKILAETIVFLGHFKDLKDPRQQADFPLEETLLLCPSSMRSGRSCQKMLTQLG